jgi:hypothetical protein
MLGWHISVYRQQNDGSSPASFGAAHGTRLAVWQTGLGGLGWIYELVEQQKAVNLGGNGYPLEFTAMMEHLKERLLEGPPGARPVWTHDSTDILLPSWLGKTTIDLEALEACRPDEWMLIQAWDES